MPVWDMKKSLPLGVLGLGFWEVGFKDLRRLER